MNNVLLLVLGFATLTCNANTLQRSIEDNMHGNWLALSQQEGDEEEVKVAEESKGPCVATQKGYLRSESDKSWCLGIQGNQDRGKIVRKECDNTGAQEFYQCDDGTIRNYNNKCLTRSSEEKDGKVQIQAENCFREDSPNLDSQHWTVAQVGGDEIEHRVEESKQVYDVQTLQTFTGKFCLTTEIQNKAFKRAGLVYASECEDEFISPSNTQGWYFEDGGSLTFSGHIKFFRDLSLKIKGKKSGFRDSSQQCLEIATTSSNVKSGTRIRAAPCIVGKKEQIFDFIGNQLKHKESELCITKTTFFSSKNLKTTLQTCKGVGSETQSFEMKKYTEETEKEGEKPKVFIAFQNKGTELCLSLPFKETENNVGLESCGHNYKQDFALQTGSWSSESEYWETIRCHTGGAVEFQSKKGFKEGSKVTHVASVSFGGEVLGGTLNGSYQYRKEKATEAMSEETTTTKCEKYFDGDDFVGGCMWAYKASAKYLTGDYFDYSTGVTFCSSGTIKQIPQCPPEQCFGNTCSQCKDTVTGNDKNVELPPADVDDEDSGSHNPSFAVHMTPSSTEQ